MKSRQLIANQRGKVYVSLTSPAKMTEERVSKLLALTKELSSVGYMLSPEALVYMSDSDMIDIMNEVVPKIHEDYYPGKHWSPLYPGFPQQVIAKTEKELWEERHILYEDPDHFLKNGSWYTEEETETIENEGSDRRDRVLGILRESDLLDIFKSILLSGNSLQPGTREELKWFLENYPDYKLPEKIPFKETQCIVMAYRKDYTPSDINDVLRYGIYAMGGDPELVHVPKLVKFRSWSKKADRENEEWRNLKASRTLRREILEKVEEIVKKKSLKNCIPDAKRFYGHWIVLSERVHPGEYCKKYPLAAEFFETLKTKEKSKNYRTWGSILQEKYDSGEDIVEIAKYISTRPGELVRRFDSLLRKCLPSHREFDIMSIFLDTAGMKNKTLLELRNYYERRASRVPRMVTVKSSSRPKVLEELDPLPLGIVDTIRETIERKILCNINDSITEKDLDGKTVYIDPEITKMPIPSGMRDKVFVVPTCTRFDIPENRRYIRMFIHWIQEPHELEDLDLHAFLYSNEGQTRNIGWNTGLKTEDNVAVHSGDVRAKPGDCAEYVDIDIDGALKAGWNYVVMSVINYQGKGLDTLDNWLGYTTLDSIKSPKKDWVPKKVDFSQKISVPGTKMAAWLFDLEKRQAILLGIDYDGIPINHGNECRSIVEFFSKPMTFTCYEILTQYYKSRGANVVNTKGGDSEISVEVNLSDVVQDYTKVLEILG